MSTKTNVTPTQQRMLALLSDGNAHTVHELRDCLFDEMGELSNVRAHVSGLRRRVEPLGLVIVCEQGTYRLARRVLLNDV